MKKLDELAHLLANPVLPKASRLWSGADVVIASAPQPDDLRRSSNPKDREVLTEHALEVAYFFEVLRDRFCEEAPIDHCSKIEFFGRLAAAADACLVEQADAAPTQAQYDAFRMLSAKEDAALKTWGQIQTADLPAVNNLVRESNIPIFTVRDAPNEEVKGR